MKLLHLFNEIHYQVDKDKLKEYVKETSLISILQTHYHVDK